MIYCVIESFVILLFIAINAVILFLPKARNTIIIALLISHLVLILFLSLVIADVALFKEITLALVIYVMVILFLIANYSATIIDEGKAEIVNSLASLRYFALGICILFIIIFSAIFILVKNIAPIASSINDKKYIRQNEIVENSIVSKTHPAHEVVKKFYFGKKINDGWYDDFYSNAPVNQIKLARLKDKLADNFLFKHFSDMILIIAGASAILLLAGKKKVEHDL